MNIKITHHWLSEYLDTNAGPSDIQKYLSLCGPSVERIEKVGDDVLYEIEVTSNRIDTASILGIAQESLAILPQFEKKAELKINPLKEYRFENISKKLKPDLKLQVEIKNKDLCPRFTAIVLDNIEIMQAPNFLRNRLTLCGTKSINNVVDISNYLMLSLGQPTHVFDYDKIGGAKMIMRESVKGEKVTTLDGKEITLPGGDIVIEDGEGKLIDLCGIMGGANSAVSGATKRVILFVQTYNKNKIRKTSLTTGQRSVASTYFEKGLDPERVEPTLVYGVTLLEEYAKAKVASNLYDIYPEPYSAKQIDLPFHDVKRLIGVSIPEGRVESILNKLGFEVTATKENLKVKVPSYRQYDVDIKEDLIEEIARIYGYHNLPSQLPPKANVSAPADQVRLFYIEQKIKYFLKHLGLNEVINYSMISAEIINNLDLKISDHLEIVNTISEEIRYLRTSLTPSLINNLKNNQGKKQDLKFFEIAKVYKKRSKDLPDEQYKLGIAINSNFSDLKGIIEALFKELNISDFRISRHHNHLLSNGLQGELFKGDEGLGYFGQLKPEYGQAYIAELDLAALICNQNDFPVYKPINPYATIILDLTIDIKPGLTFEKIKNISFKTSKLLANLEFVSSYKNKLTLRFYFSSTSKNIIEDTAKIELNKIINVVLK